MGAGISVPAFPSWPALVGRLIARDASVADADALTRTLLSAFTPDSLIQAAANLLGYSADAFSELLSEELYSVLIPRLGRKEWRLFERILSWPLAGAVGGAEWDDFVAIISREFPAMSALPLAELMSDIMDDPLRPAAIVSFNAEATFPALLSAFASRRWTDRLMPAKAGERITPFDIVTHSVSNRRPHRLPIYFCHGLLRLPNASKRKRGIQAHDKLVFSESSYLALANTTYSWQSTIFTDLCSARSVVFLGVSLTDSNMRRWLSWVHANRELELRTRYSISASSAPHYWINKAPPSPAERSWIEASVAHLGVRIVWLNEWSEAVLALRRMLGLAGSTSVAPVI